jgi:hypothetical protein
MSWSDRDALECALRAFVDAQRLPADSRSDKEVQRVGGASDGGYGLLLARALYDALREPEKHEQRMRRVRG